MICPSFGLGSPEKEGAGNAGCALHPRSRVQNAQAKTHTSIQVQRRQSGIPCAMALRLTSRSPRRRIPLVTVTSGLRFVWARSGRRVSAGLTSATDARTTRLRRTQRPHRHSDRRDAGRSSGEGLETPVVCATLDRSRESPPCDHDRARRRCVHRIQPRVRDDRDTPLLPGWMGEVIAMICPTAKAEYFFE
jgi:hypothetical protein